MLLFAECQLLEGVLKLSLQCVTLLLQGGQLWTSGGSGSSSLGRWGRRCHLLLLLGGGGGGGGGWGLDLDARSTGG